MESIAQMYTGSFANNPLDLLIVAVSGIIFFAHLKGRLKATFVLLHLFLICFKMTRSYIKAHPKAYKTFRRDLQLAFANLYHGHNITNQVTLDKEPLG